MSVAAFGAPLTELQVSDVNAALTELSRLKPNKTPAATQVLAKLQEASHPRSAEWAALPPTSTLKNIRQYLATQPAILVAQPPPAVVQEVPHVGTASKVVQAAMWVLLGDKAAPKNLSGMRVFKTPTFHERDTYLNPLLKLWGRDDATRLEVAINMSFDSSDTYAAWTGEMAQLAMLQTVVDPAYNVKYQLELGQPDLVAARVRLMVLLKNAQVPVWTFTACMAVHNIVDTIILNVMYGIEVGVDEDLKHTKSTFANSILYLWGLPPIEEAVQQKCKNAWKHANPTKETRPSPLWEQLAACATTSPAYNKDLFEALLHGQVAVRDPILMEDGEQLRRSSKNQLRDYLASAYVCWSRVALGLTWAYTHNFGKIMSENHILRIESQRGLDRFLALVPEGEARDVASRLSLHEVDALAQMVRYSIIWQ